jgi:hypothetical protein
MRVSTALTITLIVFGSPCCVTAEDDPAWRILNHEARVAMDAKDYPKLRETLLALKPLLPGNPRIAYNLAATEALLGHTDAALARLRAWAAMGLFYDLSSDDDFSSLRGTPGFTEILTQIEAKRKPAAQTRLVTQLPEKDLIPEDLAYDPGTHRFFVSSVRTSRIITMDSVTKASKTFAKSDWSVLAPRADTVRRLLWASTGWVPQCEHCVKSDEGKTALLAFNLDTGALKQRIDSPVQGLLGDMTIGRQGDIYISEGIHGAVFHLARGSAALQRLDRPGEFPSPQTPALSADEKTLYVPDYVRGIGAINLASRAVQWLQPADDIALTGIDGLYVHGHSFIAVQNGTMPARIMHFSIDLRHQEVLEANTLDLGEPTHGTIIKEGANELFYFLANTGWGEYDAQGKKKDGSAPVESFIRSVRLNK